MVLQSLKSLFPNTSERVLIEVMKDLEKCRDKDMSGLELFDWMNQLVMAHTIADALNSNAKDDSKSSQVGDESSFAIMENSDAGNN
jgi:hypothetical protein